MNKSKLDYINNSIDKDLLKTEVKGEDLLKESTESKKENSSTMGFKTVSYVGGGVSVGFGVARAASIAINVGATALKILGAGFFVIGAAVGISCGSYITNQYCQELINKFEDFYLNNAQSIGNSYKQSAEYLLQRSKSE